MAVAQRRDMTLPRASVIVRARDKARTIERTLSLLRSQTVRPEILVVDSGSTDATLDIAQRLADRVIEIPPERFTFGFALNVGAREARAPIHFALSAHCFPESRHWIERSLSHYERDDVAGTHGVRNRADGTPLTEVVYDDPRRARAEPNWGFSNHASSWRASVWQQFPFDEGLAAAEDKEWALRVLDAGWTIAADPELWVDMSHTWRGGLRNYYLRQRRCAEAIASFIPIPRYGVRDCVQEWWSQMPDDRHSPWLYPLDNRRWAGLAGRYAGYRASRQPCEWSRRDAVTIDSGHRRATFGVRAR
jgi:rhamnosyltransferase